MGVVVVLIRVAQVRVLPGALFAQVRGVIGGSVGTGSSFEFYSPGQRRDELLGTAVPMSWRLPGARSSVAEPSACCGHGTLSAVTPPGTRSCTSLVRTCRIVLVVAAVVLLGACGSGDGDERSSAESDGEALYQANCASCHGSDLRGTDQGPPHLSVVYAPDHHPDAAFRSAIENGAQAHHWGFGDMRPVEGLDDGEIEAIIAYVREQQDIHSLEPYPPS